MAGLRHRHAGLWTSMENWIKALEIVNQQKFLTEPRHKPCKRKENGSQEKQSIRGKAINSGAEAGKESNNLLLRK